MQLPVLAGESGLSWPCGVRGPLLQEREELNIMSTSGLETLWI